MIHLRVPTLLTKQSILPQRSTASSIAFCKIGSSVMLVMNLHEFNIYLSHTTKKPSKIEKKTDDFSPSIV